MTADPTTTFFGSSNTILTLVLGLNPAPLSGTRAPALAWLGADTTGVGDIPGGAAWVVDVVLCSPAAWCLCVACCSAVGGIVPIGRATGGVLRIGTVVVVVLVEVVVDVDVVDVGEGGDVVEVDGVDVVELVGVRTVVVVEVASEGGKVGFTGAVRRVGLTTSGLVVEVAVADVLAVVVVLVGPGGTRDDRGSVGSVSGAVPGRVPGGTGGTVELVTD